MAAVHWVVGLLPADREALGSARPIRLYRRPHAQMFLAKMTPPKRAAQRPEAAGSVGRNPFHGLQRESRVGDLPAAGDDGCTEQQDAGTLWAYPAVGNGDDIGRPPTHQPDAEDRTSGGVEGSPGAIPVRPSDLAEFDKHNSGVLSASDLIHSQRALTTYGT